MCLKIVGPTHFFLAYMLPLKHSDPSTHYDILSHETIELGKFISGLAAAIQLGL